MRDIVPTPGLVIAYTYLWRREHEAGEDAGRKTKPALIVIAVERSGACKTRVAVCQPEPTSPTTTALAVFWIRASLWRSPLKLSGARPAGPTVP